MTEPSGGLWPHQVEAIEAALKHLSAGGRATEVLPCGGGKSRVSGHLAAELAPHGRRLVLAPASTLLAQLIREYRFATGEAGLGRVLAVCSAELDGEAEAGLEELRAQRVRVTTSPHTIAQTAAEAGPVTVFSAYASARAVAEAHRYHRLPAWDLIVCDEAHRTVLGAEWSRVHDDAISPAERRLNMTATPQVVTGDGTEIDIVGMEEESVYGPTVYRLGYAAAVDLGILARYRLVISVITDANIQTLTRHGDGRTGSRVGSAVVPAEMLAAQIAVLRAAAQYGLSRALTFHRDQ